MAKSHSSTGGPTRPNEEAAWPMAEVGGVRSSVDPVPDLWFGENSGERRDATCSAVRRRSKGLVTALWAISAKNVRELPIPADAWASAFRGTELGKPDAGKPPVRFDEGREAKAIGYPCLRPLLPAYSTEIRVKARGHLEVVRTVLCAVREPHRDCADHSRAFTLRTLPIIPCARKAHINTGESPVGALRRFSTEDRANCVAARRGGEQAWSRTGRS